MVIKYRLDMLNNENVSVETHKYFEIDGVEYAVGSVHVKAYRNSDRGREEVKNELPIDQQNAVFAIWGNNPTVIE